MSDSTPIVDPIEAVAARMETIAAPLQEDDGVHRFNELYLAVTRAVAKESVTATFEDAAFISRLDVIFADPHFAAVDDLDAGRKPSRAQAPLFEARAKQGIAPLQFAIAGMNAHINHDLVLALVTTTKELGHDLDRDTAQHRDYTDGGLDPPARPGRDQGALHDRDHQGDRRGRRPRRRHDRQLERLPPRATTRGRRRRSSTRSAPTSSSASSTYGARAQRRLRRPRRC